MVIDCEKVFEGFIGKKEELIPLLQKVQNMYGYLSEESMELISDFTGVPPSRIHGVATFYTQFRHKPIGAKHIMLCRGTACHVKGAPRILDELELKIGITEGETSSDGEYSLESVACIGACGLAPCILINKDVKGRLTPKMVGELFVIDKAKAKG